MDRILGLELGGTMQNKELRKALGSRIKTMRKKKGWTQKELAARIEVNPPLLNKYEGGLHVPPLEKLVLLADVLDTSLDFLAVGRSDDAQLHNRRLLERFHALEECNGDDLDTVIKLVDAVIVKRRVESAVHPMG